jgi:hypothetical protein
MTPNPLSDADHPAGRENLPPEDAELIERLRQAEERLRRAADPSARPDAPQ